MKNVFFLITVVLIGLNGFSQTASFCFTTQNDNTINFGAINPTATDTSDFNNDGKTDMAMLDGTGVMYILLSTGTGAFQTPIVLNLNYASCFTINDFNGDGNKDLAIFKGYAPVSIMAGDGSGNFTNLSSSTSSVNVNSSSSALSGDFNSDGIIDLVVTENNGLTFFYGTIGGFFTTASYVSFSPNDVGINLKKADLNNDGQIDFISSYQQAVQVFLCTGATTYSYSYYGTPKIVNDYEVCYINGDLIPDIFTETRVLLGTGTGSFVVTNISSYSDTYHNYESICSGDFNNDGHNDISYTEDTGNSQDNNTVKTLFGNGLGGFTFGNSYLSVSGKKTILSGNFNSDNRSDLITTNFDRNNISVLLSNGNDGFLAANSISSSFGVHAFQFADCNADGLKDIVFVNQQVYLSVLYATSNGNYGTVVSYSVDAFPASSTPKCIAISDLNNDGKPDVVKVNEYNNSVSVIMGVNTGSFSASSVYPVGSHPMSVVLADFNNDGKTDIVVSNLYGNSISLLLNTGAGTFGTATSKPVGSGPFSLDATDFNNDGNMDIVSSNTSSNNVSILLGNGSGNFSTATNYSVGFSSPNPYEVETADFNMDGFPDIVTANYNANQLAILLGTGTGSFNGAFSLATSLNPTSLAIADFNDDGKLDIVASNNQSNNVSVFGGIGNGNFSAAASFSVGTYPNAVGVTDFNNDGIPDIATINHSSSNISKLINNTSIIEVLGLNPICAGGSVVLKSKREAFSYQWTPGGVTSNTMIVNNAGNYSLTTTNQNGSCISISSKSITVVAANGASLSVSTNSTICLGSSALLTVSSAGSYTYTWSNSANTQSVNVIPTITTTYSVVGTNSLNCSGTETVSVTVDNTCADVWPGDANSDGAADNLDVLELGLHYTQTGAPRASVSNNWQSYFANNWTGTITNGKNLNHSDCNGDGTINDNDTLAIYNNYGLTHTFKPAQTNTVNPQLSIVPDQPMVAKGNWGTASIYLGDVTTPINNINGVAFTVDFDNTLIEPNSIYIEYQNSFIDAGQNLYFRKLDFANSKLYTASTHTVSNNVNGFGKIATLHYQILSSLTTDQVLNIGISQANQSDASGTIAPLTSGTGTLMAIGASVSMKESVMGGNILISPNPTNSLLNISFNATPQNTKIELYNSIGALVLTEMMNNKNNTITMSDLSSGIYFMKVLEGNKVMAVKKVVKE